MALSPQQNRQRVAILETVRAFILMTDKALLEHDASCFGNQWGHRCGHGYRDMLVRVESMFAWWQVMDKMPRVRQRKLGGRWAVYDVEITAQTDLPKSEHFVEELCHYTAGHEDEGPWWRLVAHKIRYAWDDTDTDYIQFLVVANTQGEQRDDSPFRFARRDEILVDPRFSTLSDICAYNPVSLALLRGVQGGGQVATLCALALMHLWD